jgi:TPP-dependent pyruvate/acetoin dehydrogenase alpha subunit
LAEWETRDPLKRLGDWLVGNRFVSADDLQKMQQEEEQRIEETFKQVTVEMK